jgi:hypothetical protein
MISHTFDKGPKRINALNFIRMGLAFAETPGVRKNAKYKVNWYFKRESDLKSIYMELMDWLTGTNHKFGEYLAIRSLFGEKVARRLSKENQYKAPVICI